MAIDSAAPMSRRAFLRATAGFALGSKVQSVPAASGREYRLTAAAAQAPIVGGGYPSTDVWAYNARLPGPVLRVRQGEPLRIIVANDLSEGTTVHWHGIRLPIAMDGVPGLTQEPIRPGERFTYEFTPPDAGTFWYHPHANSLQQLGRGLAGALIVEEREPVPVDRDVLWVLGDWRLTPQARIASGFGNPMEAAMAGRVGNTVTINGTIPAEQPVRPGERIRLRLVNTALARIMALRFEGHRPLVIATDGQPCEPHEPVDGRVLLGPAMRVDLLLDMQAEPGRGYRVIDDFYAELAYELTTLAYGLEPTTDRPEQRAPFALPRNPLPQPDLASAAWMELKLQGGMMSGVRTMDGGRAGDGMMGRGGMGGMRDRSDERPAAWSINGRSMTGDGHAGMAPLRKLELGRTHVFRLVNDTAWWHPMHLHGHSFRVLRQRHAGAARAVGRYRPDIA